MPARARGLKSCPKSHCRLLFTSNDAVRGHISNFHGENPERMACGSYTIKKRYYRGKHKKECRQCNPDASVAQTVVPSIERDADSDDASTTGADLRDGEVEQAFENHKMVFNAPIYGVVILNVKGGSVSPSCSGDSN
ncbi:hypothetical protein LY78DRAFT_660944 [Colletotrichum sublineola]|uniref:C2H2-type domain-containing protein n=1 Tax=Colletotrichum sublineola TaxID=1173701 RepID=A0A066X674_COLSU|nr:hypothetical protein LY78DRAFT_660944 [Colletotrichum sublineola]KDN64467.1 hypothetical protein CSUB01_00424 [Colletotrichum sublineola]